MGNRGNIAYLAKKSMVFQSACGIAKSQILTKEYDAAGRALLQVEHTRPPQAITHTQKSMHTHCRQG